MSALNINLFNQIESRMLEDERMLRNPALLQDSIPYEGKLHLARFIVAISIVPSIVITILFAITKKSIFYLLVSLCIYYTIVTISIETHFQYVLEASNQLQQFILNHVPAVHNLIAQTS